MTDSPDIMRDGIFMAGLLHDIGKFYQRADGRSVRESAFLKGVKNEEAVFCPSYKGVYSRKHVLWTAQFIDDHSESFKIFRTSRPEDSLLQLAAKHHSPSTELQKIIQLADYYSSGMDRTEEKGMKDVQHENAWDAYIKTRMRSIFEGIFQNAQEYPYSYSLPVKPIILDASFFPKKEYQDAGAGEYLNAWNFFIEDFGKLNAGDTRSFIESFISLLHKHTVTIPGSTQHLPDVSLYDHLRSVAAFAVCIYDYCTANKIQCADIKRDSEPVLLVGGDVSGIQNFIYDIISKAASKNLKGRSFYLQLLVDSIVSRITKEIGLYSSNIVYSSGGGFYLIVPNTEENNKKLTALSEELSDNIFKEHQTSLFLAISSIKLSHDTLLQGAKAQKPVSRQWQALIEKLNALKRARFSKKMQRQYGSFFEPVEAGGLRERDFVTGEELTEEEEAKGNFKWIEDAEERSHKVKLATAMQTELGKKLRSANCLVSSDQPLKNWSGEPFNPCGLGGYFYLLNEDDLKSHKSADGITILNIREPDFAGVNISGNRNVRGFQFYGGNDFPRDAGGAPKTFDRLAGEGAFRRLGVLRMDVDNLGQVFINGFSEDMRTFSRYSALSRNLDYFFKGYLNRIWNRNQRYKENTYIVYSGGDDLFIVGRWDILIEMAHEIYKEFKDWTCHNPQLGLSGGIAVVSPKFPIAKAANLAGKYEQAAKDHVISRNGKTLEKNSFTLLGTPLHWDYEFPVVKELKGKLASLLHDNKLPHGIISRIGAFAEMRQIQYNSGRNESWRWLMAYDFGRMKQRLKKHSDAADFLENLKTGVFCDTHNGARLESNYTFLDLLNLAARWAELELRTNE